MKEEFETFGVECSTMSDADIRNLAKRLAKTSYAKAFRNGQILSITLGLILGVGVLGGVFWLVNQYAGLVAAIIGYWYVSNFVWAFCKDRFGKIKEIYPDFFAEIKALNRNSRVAHVGNHKEYYFFQERTSSDTGSNFECEVNGKTASFNDFDIRNPNFRGNTDRNNNRNGKVVYFKGQGICVDIYLSYPGKIQIVNDKDLSKYVLMPTCVDWNGITMAVSHQNILEMWDIPQLESVAEKLKKIASSYMLVISKERIELLFPRQNDYFDGRSIYKSVSAMICDDLIRLKRILNIVRVLTKIEINEKL